MLEEQIENQILHYLSNEWVSVDKIISEWFFDQKRGIHRKRKSQFARPGISDIIGSIPPTGRALYIEVKKPDEIKFFDRPVKVIEQDVIVATYDKCLESSSLKRYHHALEQARFIEEKIRSGAIAFYASSVDEVKKKLKAFWVEIS